ncbi:hypothetical protein F5I97DRAFT_1828437 [Phlebopus sp. FC_14]|nr:hypothetical protein F5I97DRAFT_1828437 [Phlebopus sp. FC_14]
MDSDGRVDETRPCSVFGIWTEESQPEESPLYNQVKTLEDRLGRPPQWWLECELSDLIPQTDNQPPKGKGYEWGSVILPKGDVHEHITPLAHCGGYQYFGFQLSDEELCKPGPVALTMCTTTEEEREQLFAGENWKEQMVDPLNCSTAIGMAFHLQQCDIFDAQQPKEGTSEADGDALERAQVLVIYEQHSLRERSPLPHQVQALQDFVGKPPRWWVKWGRLSIWSRTLPDNSKKKRHGKYRRYSVKATKDGASLTIPLS